MPSSFQQLARDALLKVETAKDVLYEDACRVIEGVIAPGHQSGSGSDVHFFAFIDWRHSGGPLVGHGLTLLRRVPPLPGGRSFDSNHFEEFRDYSIQRFSVLLSKDHQRAIVDKVLAADQGDEVLRNLSERLQIPVVVSTRQFGDLVLNRKLRWFEGKCKWNDSEVLVHLDPDKDGGIADAITTAERLWADQAEWNRKIEQIAVDRLLHDWNENWLSEGEQQFTPTAFKEAIKFQSIHVSGDGEFEFWDDGSLFGYHAIHIHGTLKDGLNTVDVG